MFFNTILKISSHPRIYVLKSTRSCWLNVCIMQRSRFSHEINATVAYHFDWLHVMVSTLLSYGAGTASSAFHPLVIWKRCGCISNSICILPTKGFQTKGSRDHCGPTTRGPIWEPWISPFASGGPQLGATIWEPVIWHPHRHSRPSHWTGRLQSGSLQSGIYFQSHLNNFGIWGPTVPEAQYNLEA